jgi:hypothetical protein
MRARIANEHGTQALPAEAVGGATGGHVTAALENHAPVSGCTTLTPRISPAVGEWALAMLNLRE